MTGQRHWVLWVDGIPPGPNSRLHWAARWRQTAPIRDAVAWQARTVAPATPLNRAAVTITLVRKGGLANDADNATARCKGLIDGLVLGGLIANDSPEHITLEVRQEKGEKRGAAILVREVVA